MVKPETLLRMHALQIQRIPPAQMPLFDGAYAGDTGLRYGIE